MLRERRSRGRRGKAVLAVSGGKICAYDRGAATTKPVMNLSAIFAAAASCYAALHHSIPMKLQLELFAQHSNRWSGRVAELVIVTEYTK